MTLQNLERALRKGNTPESLGGTQIGQGAQNVAYVIKIKTLLGDEHEVIVKTLVGGWQTGTKRPPKGITKYGARFARTYRAGQYIIQEKVTPISTLRKQSPVIFCKKEVYKKWARLSESGLGDLHAANCGTNGAEELIVFDW